MPEAIAKVEITEFKAPEKKCKRCDKPKAGLRFGVCAECNKAPRAAKPAAKPAAKAAENSDQGAGGEKAAGGDRQQGDDGELSGGAVVALLCGAALLGSAVAYGVSWAMERFGGGEGGEGRPSLTVHQGGKGNG